ncbi:DUF2829 domain-containing protein [Xanthobacter sp.]|uniref:DUF2829 domain-containing protein n=1 Tax=Xanthobacter sp. TaxID=35809 RepID=UPI0025EA5FED|nr:DUF2829 domain-containing protein [Xanthobacter sp.]
MTTSVVVKANHGWPVKVTKLDPKIGAPLEFLIEMVEPNTERTVYCHSGQDLLVHEVQPDEVPRGLSFGDALALLKSGKRVAREGWNGKGMFLFLVPGSTFAVNREPLLSIMGEGTEVQYHAHIDMKTAQGYVVPWLASQSDLLSDDWVLVAPAAV